MLKKLVSVILFLMFSTAYADAPSDTLTGLLKNMTSIQADFTQTIMDKKTGPLQKATGQMSLHRPGQFRWEVTHPNRQLIVTNSQRLWIYDPDLEQVTIRSLAKAAGETPALLLSDENLSLATEFTIKILKQSPSSWQWFYLIPKDHSSMVSSISLAFANQIIRQMKIQDHLGHTTVIDFKNIKQNPHLAASLFNFKPPKAVDIIDETRH